VSDFEALISDFGGVLTSPLEEAFAGFSEDTGISLAALGGAMAKLGGQLGANPLYELETGRLSERDFLAGLERALGDGVSMAGFADHYFARLKPNEQLFDYLRDLHARGLRLALCTNNVREWEGHWRTMLPIDEIFDVVVDSGFVGMRKPDPEIYALTLERLGGPAPDRVLFLDDIEDNCAGAREAGMTAVRFVDTDQAIADIEHALGG
jgi:putative hydrolase of the HAD superfamily